MTDKSMGYTHGASRFPHEGGCAQCRKLMQCNACGYASLSAGRCANGRCVTCHGKFCTPGGSPGHRGHGYWRKGTRPDKRENCKGSGLYAMGKAYQREKTCPTCGKWVTVRRDGKLRMHRGTS